MSPSGPDAAVSPSATRDELVAMVARAHKDAGYADAALAGRTLAAQSRLPRVIAENLGAAFGQWTFFPEAAEIVDFALAYIPPTTEADLWTLARSWASDDAAARPTLMALVGREIVQHELRRIEVATLRQLVDESEPARARALRASLGLEVAAESVAKAERKPARERKPATAAVSVARGPGGGSSTESATPAPMPKPAFRRIPKPEPLPPAKKFRHPKFGDGELESQDGVGPDAKLTIKFEGGRKTLLARYVAEVPA